MWSITVPLSMGRMSTGPLSSLSPLVGRSWQKLRSTGAGGWALFMALWGLLVISGADNVLRPLLIGKGVQAGHVVRQFDVRDITEATAIALMEDMLTGKR